MYIHIFDVYLKLCWALPNFQFQFMKKLNNWNSEKVCLVVWGGLQVVASSLWWFVFLVVVCDHFCSFMVAPALVTTFTRAYMLTSWQSKAKILKQSVTPSTFFSLRWIWVDKNMKILWYCRVTKMFMVNNCLARFLYRLLEITVVSVTIKLK